QLELVALRAPLRHRQPARRGERGGEAPGGVAPRAHVARERDVIAARARDPVGAIDERLAGVHPPALVVWLARHHVEAAIDVAVDHEQPPAAGGAAALDELVEAALVERAHQRRWTWILRRAIGLRSST